MSGLQNQLTNLMVAEYMYAWLMFGDPLLKYVRVRIIFTENMQWCFLRYLLCELNTCFAISINSNQREIVRLKL